MLLLLLLLRDITVVATMVLARLKCIVNCIRDLLLSRILDMAHVRLAEESQGTCCVIRNLEVLDFFFHKTPVLFLDEIIVSRDRILITRLCLLLVLLLQL